jgi:hypothetical protein
MAEMSIPVIKPFLLDFGLVSSGQRVISTLQVHPPSDAEVTAVMVQNDTGSFRVQQVVAYNVTKEPVDPRHSCRGYTTQHENNRFQKRDEPTALFLKEEIGERDV